MCMKDSVWGLDFGTTTSYVSESEPIFGSKLFSLRQPGLLREYVPSILRSTPDGFIVGEKAEAASEDEVLRSVKLAITRRKQTLPIYPEGSPEDVADNGPVNADSAIVAILSHVRTLVTAGLRDLPIRLGCPAMWDGGQRKRLLDLAEEAGFRVLHETLIDEPVAACIAWYSQQEILGNRPKGKTLVFDMGGGTLDIAVLKLDSSSPQPAIYVESSDGVGEAGDALDEAIFKVLQVQSQNIGATRILINRYPGWIKRAARELKELIGNNESASTMVRLPDNQSLQLKISGEELRAAFEPQFARAIEKLLWVLRLAKISEGRYRSEEDEDQSTAIDGKTMRDYSKEDLLSEVSQVLLVGGMSQMPLVKTMLCELGIPSEKFIGPELLEPNSAVALGLGLGHHRNYEQLSLDRPAFNFVLRWSKDGEDFSEVIHNAYARLYEDHQKIIGPMKITWRKNLATSASDSGWAVFRAETLAGEIIPLEGPDVIPNAGGIYYKLGDRNDAVIVLEPTGRIFLRHGNGEENTLKITRWPIFDDTGRRKLHITSPRRKTTSELLSGLAFYQIPSN